MANYIRINIGGKERGAKLGIGFLKQITEAEKIDLTELFVKAESETLLFLPVMIFHSISYNDKIAGNEVDYTQDDVYDWVDEISIQSEEIQTFSKAWIESIKVHMPKTEDEGKKTPQKGAKK
ncbi:hypothetical protein [Chryseobacterium aureum]|uniref:hypothetical protein n=1 Tax=Chryseobacterium aureum TaxID=2497456 RepID=UPI000F895D4F|nr:hypothetical protein [Chryseobacterium aureum]